MMTGIILPSGVFVFNGPELPIIMLVKFLDHLKMKIKIKPILIIL